MKLNQYAVYRVDQTSPGKVLWHKSYSEVQQEKLSIQFEYYRQQRIEKVSPKDTAMTIWNQRKDSFEVSDVLVLNKEGELTAYYISEDYLTPIEGFIRINTSGALISMETVNYHLENRKGSWMATDYIIIDGKQFFLLEHEEYRNSIPGVVLDAYGKLIADDVRNGFDDAVKPTNTKPDPSTGSNKANAIKSAETAIRNLAEILPERRMAQASRIRRGSQL